MPQLFVRTRYFPGSTCETFDVTLSPSKSNVFTRVMIKIMHVLQNFMSFTYEFVHYWKCNFPIIWSVHLLVGWLVCHNLLKGTFIQIRGWTTNFNFNFVETYTYTYRFLDIQGVHSILCFFLNFAISPDYETLPIFAAKVLRHRLLFRLGLPIFFV